MSQVPPPEAEVLRDAFREADMRLTTQREAVWKKFREAEGGMTIPEAVESLDSKRIGLSTVYRTVTLLEEMGLLRRLHDPTGEHRYIAGRPGHYHPLVCRSCGKVVQFEACGLAAVERMLAVETGFTIEGHELEMHGTCPKCQNKDAGEACITIQSEDRPSGRAHPPRD